MASLPVDTSQNDALNLQVLQRQDNQINDIIGTASHVVVYEFDQSEQSWKRKEVEGSLFIVKRYSAPRFQMFVNNRLSTSNLTVPIDVQLNVDNVDDFLILRSIDPAAPTTFKIYGIWFFPEEDRQKMLKLLERVLVSLKGAPAAAKPSPKHAQKAQPRQPQPAHDAQTESKPVAAKQHGPIGSPKKASTVVYSKAEGIAAGVAILGMISQASKTEDDSLAVAAEGQLSVATTTVHQQPPQQQQQRQKKQRDRTPPRAKQLTKDEFKDAFVQCLDDPAFLDQIYQAYAKKLPKQ